MQVPYVGVAGWALAAPHKPHFPGEGTHLERYAGQLPAVEINSSFYRPHQPKTYAKWAAAVPPGFRFAAKVPRTITHQKRLVDAEPELDRFLGEVTQLGDALGPLLVQLPPSLKFDEAAATAFFEMLRAKFSGSVVCEPRHVTWFTPVAEDVLGDHAVGRVAADPSVVAAAAMPGGDERLMYYRWHGSPEMYFSTYEDVQLQILARTLAEHARAGREVWCIFDNTGSGAAQTNALRTRDLVREFLGREPGDQLKTNSVPMKDVSAQAVADAPSIHE
jgi:uncharacterized protein YecE (DUF72 family)